MYIFFLLLPYSQVLLDTKKSRETFLTPPLLEKQSPPRHPNHLNQTRRKPAEEML